MALLVLASFFSATQDIIVDAYRIETAPQYMQGPLSSMYIAGYRVAMLVGGAGSLWLAAYFGQESYNQEVWQKVYSIMSIFMLVGIFGTLISKEPKIKREKNLKNHHHARFFLVIVISVAFFIYSYSKLNNPFSEDQILLGFIFAISRIVFCFLIVFIIIYFFTLINIVSAKSVKRSYLNPIMNFLNRYGKFAFLILLLISLYRIADVVMGVMANIFYLEKGYNISQIATYSKFFGVFATILGGFIG